MSRLALYLLGPPPVKLDGGPAHIDRTIYHGVYPEGTAIRSALFRLGGGRL